MPVTAVKFTGDTVFSNTHESGGLYTRSTSASDDGFVVLHGRKTSDSNADHAYLAINSNEGKIEQLSSTNWSDLNLARWDANLNGTGSVFSNNGTKATGSIHIHSRPSDGDTVIIGLTGFTKTFTFRTGTISANGDVYSDSDLNKTAANLASAINDSSTGVPTTGEGQGGTYGWWNTDGANPYLTANAPSGNTFTVQDKINCKRQLGWVTTIYNGSSISLCPISGGIDGTKIVDIPAGSKSASISTASGINLDSEDLSTTNVRGYLPLASDSVATRGRFAVDIKCTDPAAASNIKIQLSNDSINWKDATSTITDLDSDQDQRITGDDLFSEYTRLYFTSYSSTISTALNIKIITQG